MLGWAATFYRHHGQRMRHIKNARASKRPRKLALGVWGIGDQVLSSGTNFALNALVATHETPINYGAFSLTFAVFVIALAIARSASIMPLMLRYASASRTEQKGQWPLGLALAGLVGVAFGIPLIVCGVFMAGAIHIYLIVMGVCLPSLLMQDSWRMLGFMCQAPQLAAAADGIMLLFQAALTAVALVFAESGPSLLLSWGLGATLSALLLCISYRTWPRIHGLTRHIRDNLAHTRNLVGEQLAYAGVMNALPYVVLPSIGLIGVAALRAAQSVLGLVNVPLQGIAPMAQSYMLKVHDNFPGRVRPTVLGLSTVGALAITAYGALVFVTPGRWGAAIMGDSWRLAAPLVIATTLYFLGNWIIVGALIGLRARLETLASLRMRAVASAMMLVGAAGGGYISGVQGAAWGMAVGTLLGAALAWLALVARTNQVLHSQNVSPDKLQSGG